MEEVSNKLIIGLLLVALVFTITGTVVSVSKLNSLGRNFNVLSGAATSSGTGQTNLTITATTSLTNQNTNINFGSGRVNQTCNFCQMDSDNVVVNLYGNGTNTTNGATAGVGCCVSFSSVTSGFLLENTGNVNLSIGYTTSGNNTHFTFIGGSRAPGMYGLGIKVNPNLQAGQSGEDGGLDSIASCRGGGTLFRDSGVNITNTSSYISGTSSLATLLAAGAPANSTVAINSNGHWLCGNFTSSPLMPDNNQDAMVVDINVTIPADAVGTGVQSSFTLTFNGTSQ